MAQFKAIWTEGKGKSAHEVVVDHAPEVRLADIQAVGNIRDTLALAFLMGSAPAEIRKEAKAGKLPALLPGMGKADLDSIRKLSAVTTAQLQRAWNKRDVTKRTRPTLDGLKRLIHAPKPGNPRTDWQALALKLVDVMGESAAMAALSKEDWDAVVNATKA
jgi:hypothetical protein